MGAVDAKDRIPFIFGKCKAIVNGVCYFLGLLGSIIQGVNGDNTISLIRKEARGVVRVDDGRPGKDLGVRIRGVNGDWLVGPVIEIFRSGMAPMLIAGYIGSWIIWERWSVMGKQSGREKTNIDSRDGRCLQHRGTCH